MTVECRVINHHPARCVTDLLCCAAHQVMLLARSAKCLTGGTRKIFVSNIYWAALSLSFRWISIRMFTNIIAWGFQVRKNDHNIVSQAAQQKPCVYVYCVNAFGGRVLLQARKLKPLVLFELFTEK